MQSALCFPSMFNETINLCDLRPQSMLHGIHEKLQITWLTIKCVDYKSML